MSSRHLQRWRGPTLTSTSRFRYFVVLLEAYGVDADHTNLRWADNIDGVSLDWPLGAVIRSTCATADGC